MDNQITITRFASILAKSTGYRQEFCEQFVLEMFRTIEDGLRTDRDVKIKGLGNFILSDDGNVGFVPDNAIVSVINEPFSFFEPEELADGITEEILADGIETTKAESELETSAIEKQIDNCKESDDKEIRQTTEQSRDNINDIALEEVTSEEKEIPSQRQKSEPIQKSVEDTENTEDAFSDISHRTRRRRYTISAVIAAAFIGAIIGMGVSYLLLRDHASSINVTGTMAAEIGISDNPSPAVRHENRIDSTIQPEHNGIGSTPAAIQENIQNPETEIITETVSSNNYLATMARRHYGRYEFWVYIYEENASILEHPDRIDPNTVVVIPSADKYGIDRNDPESVRKAVALAKEIYARF